jgi:hypothetical protein
MCNTLLMSNHNDPMYQQPPDPHPEREWEAHLTAGIDSPVEASQTAQSGCDFCKQTHDDYIHVEYGDNVANLCSWTCVIAFSAVKAHECEARLYQRVLEISSERDESETWLAHYQAGTLGRAAHR